MIRNATIIMFLMLGNAAVAFAGIGAAPEIDPTAAAGAVALVAGGAVVIRNRRRNR
jgi:MYXO-CTERM domain-containing protein